MNRTEKQYLNGLPGDIFRNLFRMVKMKYPMQIPTGCSSILPQGNTLLTGLLQKQQAVPSSNADSNRQREKDRIAKQILDDIVGMAQLVKIFGQWSMKKEVARALVPFREASILTGITETALKSAALNVYNVHDFSNFPLYNLTDLAAREARLSGGDSNQADVERYIRVNIKDEYRHAMEQVCSFYLELGNDEAKEYEAYIHVITCYYRMNPPSERNLNKESGQGKSSIIPQQKHQEINKQRVKSEVSQKEVAEGMVVTVRTVRNWESGKTPPPDGYPGRRSRTAYLMFLHDYNANRSLKMDARAKNNAISGGDMNDYSEGVEF